MAKPLFTGMMRSRISLLVAWSEMARFTRRFSPARRSMPPTRPTVDTVMRRGDMAKPGGIGEDPERLHRGLVVGERLAHAHVHDVREPPARLEHPRGADHLPDDLARAEIPLEPHRARVAEGAREAAADLGGHAEREPVAVGHQHRLHARPVGEDEDDLLAAILRRRPALHLGHADEGALAERVAGSRAADRTWRRCRPHPSCRSTSRSAARDTAAPRATRRAPRARTARDRTS